MISLLFDIVSEKGFLVVVFFEIDRLVKFVFCLKSYCICVHLFYFVFF